ncbi:dimethyladenosine transferase 1, mitochondrial-like [Babylonia areolata]|uniref:dimethyladenosine transferase 1, mitochondrial-like n=1 Tax=Babylonia areolata TaxID=304850 RepID=UPI003FD144F9
MGAQRLPPLPTIQELIRLYQLRAKKQLSQNFLLDMNLTRKIVRMAGPLQGGFVCEVGPGPGGITRPLLNTKANHVAVLEKDRRFMPSLKMLSDAAEGRMSVYEGDVLDFNFEHIIPKDLAQPWNAAPPNIHIIGNLPFSVSTPLLIKWLAAISTQSGPWTFGRTKLTLTFQKEVAERMVARIMTRQRCRLSIMCQYLCDVQLKFIIPGRAFVPPPDVDVGVVHIVPKVRPLIQLPFPLVEKVASHVCHYRQKYIRRGIETLFPVHREDLVEEMFEASGVDPQSRSYMLSVREIGHLCHAYSNICSRESDIYGYDYRSPENAAKVRRKNEILTELIEQQVLHGTDPMN